MYMYYVTTGYDRLRGAAGVDPERDASGEHPVRAADGGGALWRRARGMRTQARPGDSARQGPDRDRRKGQLLFVVFRH